MKYSDRQKIKNKDKTKTIQIKIYPFVAIYLSFFPIGVNAFLRFINRKIL